MGPDVILQQIPSLSIEGAEERVLCSWRQFSHKKLLWGTAFSGIWLMQDGFLLPAPAEVSFPRSQFEQVVASGAQQPAAALGMSSGGFAALPEKHSSNFSLPSPLKSGPHLEVGAGAMLPWTLYLSTGMEAAPYSC